MSKGPIDVLDHASRGLGYGSKMGIDATRKWPNEGYHREWPVELSMTPEVKERIDRLWPELELDHLMNPKSHPDRWWAKDQ
jgi:4-hydroxy-3-polyprenylbenzoate decarboxylase